MEKHRRQGFFFGGGWGFDGHTTLLRAYIKVCETLVRRFLLFFPGWVVARRLELGWAGVGQG